MALEPIRPKDLAPATLVTATGTMIPGDNGAAVERVTPSQIVNAVAPVASLATAIAGVNNTQRMTPLTVKQVLDNEMASSVALAQAWAESETAPSLLDPASKSSKTWAAASATSAANAALYDCIWLDDLPSVIADTVLSYTAGAGKTLVSAGSYVLTRNGFSYTVAASGATDHNLTTSGGVKLYVKPVGGAVTPAQFGTGQTALEAAITYARVNNVACDGLGATYTLSSAITAIPGQVRNMTIDASAVATATAWQPFGAAYEALKLLTVDTRQGKRLWNATAHGYAIGDTVLIQSTLVIETGTNSQAAHWGRISAVTTNTFTTHEAALCNFLTGNAASVRRLPKSAAVVMDNVKIIGGATCVNGFWPVRFTDLTTDMAFENCKSRSLVIQECYAPYVRSNRASMSDAPGLGYGVALVGNGWARVDLAMGQRCRHTLTTGSAGVIPTVGGSVGDVIARESLAAGMDTHPATLGFRQTGKAVVDMSAELASEDAVVWQAIGGSINCEVMGDGNRNTVTIQPQHVAAAFDFPPIFSVTARSTGLNAKGVSVDFSACGAVKSCDVDYAGTSTGEAVYFDIGAIAVDSLRVSGAGTSTTGRAMRIICNASADLGYVEQSGNWQAAANEASYILCQTLAGSRTTQWSFGSGRSAGGAYGMRATNKVAAIVGATFLAGSTGPTFVSGGGAITVLT